MQTHSRAAICLIVAICGCEWDFSHGRGSDWCTVRLDAICANTLYD